MSKIVVALALTVLLLGATLFIGSKVTNQVALRGANINDSLSQTNLTVDANGNPTTKMP